MKNLISLIFFVACVGPFAGAFKIPDRNFLKSGRTTELPQIEQTTPHPPPTTTSPSKPESHHDSVRTDYQTSLGSPNVGCAQCHSFDVQQSKLKDEPLKYDFTDTLPKDVSVDSKKHPREEFQGQLKIYERVKDDGKDVEHAVDGKYYKEALGTEFTTPSLTELIHGSKTGFDDFQDPTVDRLKFAVVGVTKRPISGPVEHANYPQHVTTLPTTTTESPVKQQDTHSFAEQYTKYNIPSQIIPPPSKDSLDLQDAYKAFTVRQDFDDDKSDYHIPSKGPIENTYGTQWPDHDWILLPKSSIDELKDIITSHAIKYPGRDIENLKERLLDYISKLPVKHETPDYGHPKDIEDVKEQVTDPFSISLKDIDYTKEKDVFTDHIDITVPKTVAKDIFGGASGAIREVGDIADKDHSIKSHYKEEDNKKEISAHIDRPPLPSKDFNIKDDTHDGKLVERKVLTVYPVEKPTVRDSVKRSDFKGLEHFPHDLEPETEDDFHDVDTLKDGHFEDITKDDYKKDVVSPLSNYELKGDFVEDVPEFATGKDHDGKEHNSAVYDDPLTHSIKDLHADRKDGKYSDPDSWKELALDISGKGVKDSAADSITSPDDGKELKREAVIDVPPEKLDGASIAKPFANFADVKSGLNLGHDDDKPDNLSKENTKRELDDDEDRKMSGDSLKMSKQVEGMHDQTKNDEHNMGWGSSI